MKYEVLDKEGKKVGEASLPKKIFEIEPNYDLIHQVIVSLQTNKRKSTAHTKDRSEVSGGGRKPWAQKGLGKARHGSTRSPIWVKGGVAFGPRNEKIYGKIIPKKMKRKALFMLLSLKAKEKNLVLLEELTVNEIKTKEMAKMFSKLPLKKKNSLLVLPENDKKIILSVRNIPFVKIIQAKDLNCLELASIKHLIMPKKSLKVIEETFLKKAD